MKTRRKIYNSRNSKNRKRCKNSKSRKGVYQKKMRATRKNYKGGMTLQELFSIIKDRSVPLFKKGTRMINFLPFLFKHVDKNIHASIHRIKLKTLINLKRINNCRTSQFQDYLPQNLLKNEKNIGNACPIIGYLLQEIKKNDWTLFYRQLTIARLNTSEGADHLFYQFYYIEYTIQKALRKLESLKLVKPDLKDGISAETTDIEGLQRSLYYISSFRKWWFLRQELSESIKVEIIAGVEKAKNPEVSDKLNTITGNVQNDLENKGILDSTGQPTQRVTTDETDGNTNVGDFLNTPIKIEDKGTKDGENYKNILLDIFNNKRIELDQKNSIKNELKKIKYNTHLSSVIIVYDQNTPGQDFNTGMVFDKTVFHKSFEDISEMAIELFVADCKEKGVRSINDLLCPEEHIYFITRTGRGYLWALEKFEERLNKYAEKISNSDQNDIFIGGFSGSSCILGLFFAGAFSGFIIACMTIVSIGLHPAILAIAALGAIFIGALMVIFVGSCVLLDSDLKPINSNNSIENNYVP